MSARSEKTSTLRKEYMLPALENAGEIYSIRVKDGFDMQY